MSYLRVKTPRIYTDEINWKLSKGRSSDKFTVIGDMNTGYDKFQLIDLSPHNRCSFDTSANTTDHIIMQWETIGSDADKFDYIAILNHNIPQANGKIRVGYHSSPITGEGQGTDVSNLTKVINGTVSGVYATPSENGSTILTFDEVDGNPNKYWFIEIEDNNQFSGSDLEIGSVMMGEYYDFPHNPNVSVKRTVEYDGVKIQKAVGGKRYGTATHLGGDDYSSATFGQPFVQSSVTATRRRGGRIGYQLQFSHLADTDVMPSDLTTPYGDTVIHDIVNKLSMNLFPFVFAVDGDSTIEGDYLFARMNDNTMKMSQTAPNLWNIGFSLSEEF
jgi:hypothetical protein